MTVLINGIADPEGVVSVLDPMVTRGDGCFESIRSYRGRPFRLGAHLERLARSAAVLDIPLPALGDLTSWAEQVAADAGDCSIRILASAGSEDGHPVVIVFPLPLTAQPASLRLSQVAAPWHPAGVPWELAGVKTLSYAPNMAAQRVAVADGYDDALLLGRGGEILELPTSSIAWVVDGVIETPTLELGILASITRAVALELASEIGTPWIEGVWKAERLDTATEVMVWSTVREVTAVSAIDDHLFGTGPVTARLVDAFRACVQQETGVRVGGSRPAG